MLGAANDKVKEHAVRAIGNIASISAKCRDRVLDADVLPPLIALGTGAARHDTNLDLLRTISWAFKTILSQRPLPKWSRTQVTAPVLARLLNCSDEQVMRDACSAIALLTQDAIVDAGAVPRLVQLLSHANTKVVTPALKALRSLTCRDYSSRLDCQKWIQAVLDCDYVMPTLRKLLSHKVSHIRQNACWVISYIAGGHAKQIEVVLKADIIALLLDRSREEALPGAIWTIINATTGGVDAQVRFIASHTVIPPLCQCLTANDTKQVLAALRSIDTILRIGAVNARTNGVTTNEFARNVELCGGLASLASLRFSSLENDDYESKVAASLGPFDPRYPKSPSKVQTLAEQLILTHFDEYTVPDQVHPLEALPTPFDESQCRRPRTLREIDMMRVMGAIREKPDWYTKVDSAKITSKWTAEALAQCPSLTPASLQWCIEELRCQASKRVGPIQHAAIDGVWQADGLIDSDLKAALLAGVSRLASVPADQLDWHPGTNQQVLDLVHPSMYCYRIGESRVTEERFGMAEAISMIGQGAPSEVDEDNDNDNDEDEDEESAEEKDGSDDEAAVEDENEDEEGNEDDDDDPDTSSRFQWLPAEFRVGDDGGVAVESYINNLHPVEEAALYPVIGDIFARFVPMFERVLAHLRTPTQLRITPNPYIWYRKPRAHGDKYEAQAEPELDDDEYDDYWDHRPIYIPDVGKFYPTDAPASRRVTLAGRRLQVIVKIARIHLTPESPTYSGGSWHVEGMRNESIVASGIYYFASENVSESRLAFRQAVETPAYEQNDDRGVRIVYGLENEGSLNQVLGSVITCADRCIAFPNIYQHQVQPFHLTDASRPGHRSILVFFLVDPSIETVSSAVVPPQQAHWARTAVTYVTPPHHHGGHAAHRSARARGARLRGPRRDHA